MLTPGYRIRSFNIRSIMGVPGDMNLELLDYIDEVKDLNWGELSPTFPYQH